MQRLYTNSKQKRKIEKMKIKKLFTIRKKGVVEKVSGKQVNFDYKGLNLDKVRVGSNRYFRKFFASEGLNKQQVIDVLPTIPEKQAREKFAKAPLMLALALKQGYTYEVSGKTIHADYAKACENLRIDNVHKAMRENYKEILPLLRKKTTSTRKGKKS